MNNQQGKSRTERDSSLRVIQFSREECPFSNRDHTWQQFHTFRNAVLDILSSYGSVGPFGKRPILDSNEESLNDWHVIDSKPDFFVVDDDMYGMSVRVEANCILAKPALLEELTKSAAEKGIRKRNGRYVAYLTFPGGREAKRTIGAIGVVTLAAAIAKREEWVKQIQAGTYNAKPVTPPEATPR